MRVLGEVGLLSALVATGFGAIASFAAEGPRRPWFARLSSSAGAASTLLLSIVMAILAWALATKDFSFDYVAQYASQKLPWYYALSAVWVGQAGSLLLWAWLLSLFALSLLAIRKPVDEVRRTAFGVLLACVFFLVLILVFAADPMRASVLARREGAGLSPLLQHPSMLIHPPVIFAGYAAWTVPFAWTVAALWHGRRDEAWTAAARRWALVAWMVLGAGILLGADWAYQELGWGGYWAWDPVENGSLIPWLSGTALVHALMAWRYRQTLKKTSVALAIVTFGLCNFATFLTRSGIFSSVHAFSQSPIGWFFLALMIVLIAGGAALIVWRRVLLRPEQELRSIWSREALILIGVVLWSALAVVVTIGTLIGPLSQWLGPRPATVGPEFYNRVLLPIGLTLLVLTAIVPLVRWGRAPSRANLRALAISGLIGIGAGLLVATFGLGELRGATIATVVILAAVSLACLVASIWLEAQRLTPGWPGLAPLLGVVAKNHRRYAAYIVHLGFVCLAVGVAGSSLGTYREELELAEGESVTWHGRTIRHAGLQQRETGDRLIAEAKLEVQDASGRQHLIQPARHFHLLQREWTSEVAIASTWRGDLYAILHAGLGEGRIYISLVWNPLMRWLWAGGVLMCVGTLIALVPNRRRRASLAHGRDQDDQQTNLPRILPFAAADAESSSTSRRTPRTTPKHSQGNRTVPGKRRAA